MKRAHHHFSNPGGVNSGKSGVGGPVVKRSVWVKHESLVFDYKPLDCEIDTDVVWKKSFGAVEKKFLIGKSEAEANSLLMQATSQNFEMHCEVVIGLLYGILSSPGNCVKLFKYLNYIVRDGHGHAISKLTLLIHQHFHSLSFTSKKQLIFLVSEFSTLKVMSIESVLLALLRYVKIGDISEGNVWLCNALLDVFNVHSEWLLTLTSFVPHALSKFIRCIGDHYVKVQFKELKAKEIKFCCKLLNERFLECAVIGRDLIRLLISVGQIEEFQEIWKLILFKPGKLSPHFEGMIQLMTMNTERGYITHCLTPQMENEINFMLSTIRNGYQKRFQQWFTSKYLFCPEGENLICDLIRFICVCYHPTNAQLCSDLVPRWVVIGWLLKLVKSEEMIANAKLALFFDFFFFNKDKTNIMNIEPGALLIFKSLGKYNEFSAGLFEFLITMSLEFYPDDKEFVMEGLSNSFHILLSRGVLPSLSPVLKNDCFGGDFKTLVKEHYGMHFGSSVPDSVSVEKAIISPTESRSSSPVQELDTESAFVTPVFGSEVDENEAPVHVLSAVYLQEGMSLLKDNKSSFTASVFPKELDPVGLADEWALDDDLFKLYIDFVVSIKLTGKLVMGQGQLRKCGVSALQPVSLKEVGVRMKKESILTIKVKV